MSTDTLARKLAELERRLKGLERGTRLDRAAVVVDSAGTSLDVRQALADSTTASYHLALALTQVVTPADQALGTVPARFSDAPTADELDPAGGSEGDVLFLRAEQTLWRHRGGAWVFGTVNEQAQAPAFAAADQAVTTADGVILTTWQATEPPAGNFGDLWFKTDTANAPHRWTDATGWQPLNVTSAQSANYVPAEAGWAITADGGSQFKDLSVLGQASVPQLSVDELVLGGTNLVETLGGYSIGKIISGRLAQQGADLAMSTTITKLFELNCGTVPGGRTYRAQVTCLIRNTAAVATTDRLQFGFRYTTDGSTPTVTSPLMDGGFNDNSCTPSGNWQSYTFSAEVDLASTVPLKIGFTADLLGGSGSYVMYALSSTIARPVFSLFDDGPLGARQDSAITVTGGGTSRFVKTFSATWAWGANAADGSILTNSWASIGGFDDYAGYVGFDSAAMVAALSGAISPVSLVARWRPRTRVSSAGLDARLCSHNFSSSAAASGAAGGWPAFAGSNLATMGLTLLSNIRNNGVPGTSYDESLGTTVFNQFKSGTRKGLAWLGWPTEAVGGEGSVYLDGTNQVQLIFTYDGTS